jgi:hypothetical protein
VAESKYIVSKEFEDSWKKYSTEELAKYSESSSKYMAAYMQALDILSKYLEVSPGEVEAGPFFRSQYRPDGVGDHYIKSSQGIFELNRKIVEKLGTESSLDIATLKSNRFASANFKKLSEISKMDPTEVFMNDFQVISKELPANFDSDIDEALFSELRLYGAVGNLILPNDVIVNEYNRYKNQFLIKPYSSINEPKVLSTPAGGSPINQTGTASKPGTISSAINPVSSAGPSNEAISSNEGQVTSVSSEVSVPTPINVQSEVPKVLAPENKTSVSNENTVNNQSQTVLNTNAINNQESNFNTSNNYSSGIENVTNQTQSVVNEPGGTEKSKTRVEKGGFLSRLEKVTNAVTSTLNLPTVKEIGGQFKELAGISKSNFNEDIRNIKKTVNKKISQANEVSSSSVSTTSNNPTSTNTSQTNSENVTNTNLSVSRENPPQMKSTPTSSSKVINNETSNSSVSATEVANTSPSQTVNNTSSTQSNTTSNQSAQQAEQVQPIVNIDLTQLAQSINRLERILLSGIEVTVKES